MAHNRAKKRAFWRGARSGYSTVGRRSLKRQHREAEPYRPIEGREHQPERAAWRTPRSGSLPWENGAV